ncbi:hypothetical protein PC9H_010580 [Pleurotus ostreatus]|uniref:ABM domain-containing protein n=3 Tax=Pleurotus TaxID=5320 RepID=A0A067NC36_PLEO1|nr:uncharacterized protein PC9H_010580 [Pleurotus ostreatus]KAF7422424.1 hypothetical protein PC9H_010580 [Pleurotus ostreatus]KAG9227692.1 hypothetical protein CCMSSC00406_0000662 [Pleurotus cornucopiae]KAJ8691736.1 hypothetical protein PTI98_011274 [Pleurotus ostreatus]KDQ25608.1 hypothetical protein PLEOSDRAFT_1090099 [Pleurotus ostreatus PC15]
MPLIEVLAVNVSDGFTKDPKVVYQLVNILKNVPGYITTYYGFQQEDKTKGYVLNVWETYEHHAALMQEPNYPEVVTAFSLMPAAPMPENTVMDHVAFAPYPVTALDAPVTEMAILTLKEGQDAKVLNEELAKLAKALDAAKGAHPPCSFGASRQRPEHNVLLVGWDNVQAHLDSVYGPGGPTDVIERLGKLADVSFSHTAFTKVQF